MRGEVYEVEVRTRGLKFLNRSLYRISKGTLSFLMKDKKESRGSKKGTLLKNKAVDIVLNLELEKLIHEWFYKILEKIC